MTIDNSALIQMCNDCGAVGFVPEVTYAYDDAAETVTVTNASTIPGGDTLKVIKAKVHDFFGGDVSSRDAAAPFDPLVLDVSGLNRSKPLALTVTIITTNGIIADGGAYGLQAAGDVASWDVEVKAQA